MRKLMLLALVPIAACAASAAQRTTTNQVGLACDARALGKFVGQAPTQELGLKLMGYSRASSMRWVAFGAMVTMEFDPRRLTVRLDQQGRIAAIACG
jgi:hypothetical protein